MKNRIAVILISILTVGCFGLFDSGSETIVGKYKLLWIDLQENQVLCESYGESGCIGLIPEYVFAVGHNDSYIIAKQHPTSGFEGGYEIYTDTTNYFIIDLDTNIKRESEKTIGPLNKIDFEKIRDCLKISDIKFDITYPDSW